MSKVLILLNAGPEDPTRVSSALGLTRVLKSSPDIENVALIFFGNAVELLTNPDYKTQAESFLTDGVLTLACRRHAEQKNLVEQLDVGSVSLKYVGEDIVRLVKEGYQVISF